MAETITAGAGDSKGSLVRRRNLNAGECANWTTIPGFRFAEAIDLILNGSIYATKYEIYGEGDPSTNYDNATAGSSYLNISCGAEYQMIEDDDGNLEWASCMHAIIEGDDTTVDFTAFPAGGINYIDITAGAGADYIRVKSGAAASDETKTITIT
jgi:hypothetical protein